MRRHPAWLFRRQHGDPFPCFHDVFEATQLHKDAQSAAWFCAWLSSLRRAGCPGDVGPLLSSTLQDGAAVFVREAHESWKLMLQADLCHVDRSAPGEQKYSLCFPVAACSVLEHLGTSAAGGTLVLGALNAATMCDTKVPDAEDDEDEDFDFNFAKPPVVSAPLHFKFSVQVQPSAAGQRPKADVHVESMFSLPVERGWPRDQLQPKDVASFMSEVLADRLPRFAADFWDLQLVDAPLQLRGYQQWSTETHAQLRSPWLPKICLVTLQRLPFEVGFDLGASGKLTVQCEPSGLHVAEGEERLDLRMTTILTGFPVAGAAWGWLGCGGRWWFERFRLPTLRKMFQAYHEMVHEQMMLYYVAALKS